MRAIITTLTAALFLVAATFSTQANNSRHDDFSRFGRHDNYGSHNHHRPPPPHVCKIVIIFVPKITWVSWGPHGRFHRPHITYIKIKKVICHRPISRDDWSDDWHDDGHGHDD